MTGLQQILIQIGLQIATSLVLIYIFLFFSKIGKRSYLFIFYIFFIATIAIYFIPRFPFFSEYQMNWQGQIFAVILVLAFVFLTNYLTPKQAGITFKINKTVWLPLIILSILGILFNIFVRGLGDINPSKEYLFYELTMPGLSEEMTFRGVLLGLLNVVFISRKNILGANMGWGALILCLAFGLGHSIYFDSKQHIQFSFEVFLVTTILAGLMTYLKEKGESIIPSIIFHNIYNATLPIISLFI